MRVTTLPPRPSESGFSEVVLSVFTGSDKAASEASLGKAEKPVEILRALTGKLGREWILWEPETLWVSIREAFPGPLSEVLKNKIQAVKALLTSSAFWIDHVAFEKIAVALNNHVPLFDQYQNPSPAMLANALEEAGLIRSARFSDEVLRYIAVVAYQDGLMVLPEPLDIAQEHLDELTRGTVGRQFKEDIARRWSEAKGAPEGLYQETLTGIHLAKMAAIREYVETF